MKANVELIYPARLNLQGVIYERGVKTPVDFDTANELAADERFRVTGLNTPEAIDHAARKSRPIGANLREAILTASEALDVQNDENFDRSGKFSVAAIGKQLGYPITAEERDEALRRAHAAGSLEQADGAKAAPIKVASSRIVRVSPDKKEEILKGAKAKDADKPAAPHVEPAEQGIPC